MFFLLFAATFSCDAALCSQNAEIDPKLPRSFLNTQCDKVSVEDFKADHIIELWWKSEKSAPKSASKEDKQSEEATDTDSGSIILEDWDNWFQIDS